MALFDLIQCLADNKYWLGRRYAEWCTAAPTLESAVAAAAMAQDEIGHARSLYPLFRHFTGHDVEPEDRQVFHSLTTFEQPFGSWVDFVATNFLADTALTIFLQSARDSSYDDLRNRARRITGEEEVHWLHGKGWVRRLAAESDNSRQALERALQNQSAEAMMVYGPPEDSAIMALLDRGVVVMDPEGMREAFLSRVNPVLEQSNLTVIDGSSLPWNEWDGHRRRITT